MAIKDLLPKKEKETTPEFYWSLAIEPGWIQAGIWKIEDEKAHVVATSLPSAWELEEELIETADAALSAAIQNLSEIDKEPSKTVFGVVPSWVKKGEISKEHLERIKNICSKLSLSPAGFVVIPEAIAHFVKSKEGSPLNALVMGISKDTIEMSVFKLGNLVGTSKIARSVSIFDDVSEGLTRFADGEFPTRFVLYNGKEGELEEVRQALLRADWDDLEKVKFLHTPKIEILTSQEKIQAVSLAGASDMGNVESVMLEKTKPGIFPEGEVDEEGELENVVEPERKITAQDVGFTIGADIADKEGGGSRRK